MTSDKLKKFFKTLENNLNSKNVFYTYFNEKKNFNDLKEYIKNFTTYLNLNFKNKNRLKIVTISEKNFEMYSSIYGIFLTRNIWIPISINLPLKRIIKMLEITKPDLIITEDINDQKKTQTKNFCKKNNIVFTSFSEIVSLKSDKKLSIKPKKIKNTNIVTIFFTSGSTGEPKGIKINYDGFIHSFFEQNRILYSNKKYNYVFGDYHETSFVISLNIALHSFFLGGTISPAKYLHETSMPINHLVKNKINTLITVPSTISRIKKYKRKISNKILCDNIILCGEPFPLSIYNYILNNFKNKRIFNCYGSTELSPWIFSHQCNQKDLITFKKDNLVPIGKPYKYTKIKIINNELYVSGKMLAPGYLDERENKKKFINIENIRWYKTGDIVKKHQNNTFVIKGRIDRIVKIRGFRVELPEIEGIFNKKKDVTNSFCHLIKNEKDELLSCIIETKKKYKDNEMVNYCKQSLPAYMIPKKFVFLKKFPINKSGKIDRKKLIRKLNIN